ncbi:MAG: ATP-binding protein [Mycobacterium leprae]
MTITTMTNLASERMKRREARIRQLEQEREQREAAIYARIPRLAEIKELQAEIGVDLARLVLKAKTRFGKSFEELRQWSAALSAERAELLRRNGIDPQELEVHWDCPACKNTGWLAPEIVEGQLVRPARKCDCLVQEEINDLYRGAGLTGLLREQTFADFDLTVYPPEDRKYMAALLETSKEYARRLGTGAQVESLLFVGDVGRGKTFLSSCIANDAVAARRMVVYFTFAEFLDLIRLHRFDDEERYREGIQRLMDADLIVLDDLGAEKVTEFVGQELFNLINNRMNRRMPMVVSTNLTPGEIEDAYGPRIASRLLNGFRVFALKGDDVRKVLKFRRAERGYGA